MHPGQTVIPIRLLCTANARSTQTVIELRCLKLTLLLVGIVARPPWIARIGPLMLEAKNIPNCIVSVYLEVSSHGLSVARTHTSNRIPWNRDVRFSIQLTQLLSAGGIS